MPVCKYLIETALPGIINAATQLFDFLGQHQGVIDAIGAALIGAFAAGKIAPLVTKIIGFIKGIISTISGAGGLMAAIKGVVTFLGGPLTIGIAAAIAAGILLIKNWDSVKETFGKVVEWISEKTEQFKETWKNAWENVRDAFKNAFDALVGIAKVPINGVIGLINGMLRGIMKGVNFAIGALNRLKIDVPKWVPGIGGSTWGFNIPTIEAPQIPYLAQGTVIPPRAREFAAILGDNNQETEVVSPLSTMKQAFIEAMKEYGESGSNGSSKYIVLNIDGHEFIRWVQDQNGQYRNRNGYGLFEG